MSKGYQAYADALLTSEPSGDNAAVLQHIGLVHKTALHIKARLPDHVELEELELWDAFSYHITVIEKITVPPKAKYLSPSKKWYHGEYLFTIDSCHADHNLPNINYSQVPEEHKSFNILELENGHFAAQPNNRTLFYDKSLTPAEPKQPDFKVSTIEYNVESVSKWTAGDDTNFFYKFKEQS